MNYPRGATVTLEELERDPHPVLARLRESEPVSWVPALGGWIVTSRELGLFVMRDAETFTVDDTRFSTAQVVGPSMLSLDGGAHAAQRNPFARPFRLDAVRERFSTIVEMEVDRLLDGIAPSGTADLRLQLAAPLSVAVMVAALGLEETRPEVALGWYADIVADVTAITAGQQTDGKGTAAFARLRDALEPALDRDPSTSLVAAAASEAGGLSRQEVASNAAVLLFGGIETTEAMIATCLLHVLSNDVARTALEAEPSLLANAVEESMRLEPAACVIDRYATRAVEVASARVEQGDLVIVSLAGANRDPAVFPDPDRFAIRRDNSKLQVGFAQGPHVCLGMHLARLETRIALRSTLARLTNLRLDPARPSVVSGLVFRKPQSLWAQWEW